MAQRAIIGINGRDTPFSGMLSKIRTKDIDGSNVTWVPEADTRCTALTMTENGSKNASDEGVYGWDIVTVSVPNAGSVTGTKNGVEYRVTVDSSGNLVYTRI